MNTTTLENALLATIHVNYQDDEPWLIYADWLEEHGDPRAAMFRRPRFSNSIGMRFQLILPGTFLMGSPEDEEERWNDETQHPVTLTQPFYLGIHTVTQAQWEAVMGENPSRFEGKDLPVERVSWDDCQVFLEKLNGQEGPGYRLPTEAEWEYACRAGTTTPFSFGETISTDQVNYDGNYPYEGGEEGIYRGHTTPVGSFPPNAWGLFDMHGNVWEWCQDWGKPYPQGSQVDPQGPSQGSDRVNRGGGWINDSRTCRSANRDWDDPASRSYCLGSRLAFSPFP